MILSELSNSSILFNPILKKGSIYSIPNKIYFVLELILGSLDTCGIPFNCIFYRSFRVSELKGSNW